MDEMIERLKTFDRAHGWNGYEKAKTREEKIAELYKQVVHMTGELGEFANELKKDNRDGTWRPEVLQEEVADMQIFLLKIALTLDMNLKKVFFEKVKKNEKRFAHFKKEQSYE